MPAITSTVYPTQTYTARLPVATGSWHGVDGALSEVTKYYFADGSASPCGAGTPASRRTCIRTTWAARWPAVMERTEEAGAMIAKWMKRH